MKFPSLIDELIKARGELPKFAMDGDEISTVVGGKYLVAWSYKDGRWSPEREMEIKDDE